MTKEARAATPIVVALVGLSLGGCADSSEPEAPSATRVDSAGVEIVTSPAPSWTEDSRWRIDPEPMLTLGSVDGDPATAFQQVHDATRLADGSLVVSEWGSAELRVFDASGAHISTFGGYGEGPTEFGTPPFLTHAGDTIVVWDSIRLRYLRFDKSGTLLEERSFPEIRQEHGVISVRAGGGWAFTADGSLLSSGPNRPQRAEGIQDRTLRLVAFGADGSLQNDFGSLPSGQSFWIEHPEGGRRGISNAFAPATVADLGVGSYPITVAEGPDWEVKQFATDGTLGRILRAGAPRAPVTDELLEAERADFPRLVDGMGLTLGQVEDAFDQIPVPDEVPAIGLLEWSSDGHLWVARRTRRIWDLGDFDIVSPNGAWLGTVEAPPDLGRTLEVGPDYLLAARVGELDVPYLDVFRVVRPGS